MQQAGRAISLLLSLHRNMRYAPAIGLPVKVVKRRNAGNPSIDDLERAPLPATSERSSRHFTPLDSLRGLAAQNVSPTHFARAD